jgi:hypothetical protein
MPAKMALKRVYLGLNVGKITNGWEKIWGGPEGPPQQTVTSRHVTE